MKIKVSPFSSKILRQYATVIAILSALASFYFIIVEIAPEQKNTYIIVATCILLFIYAIIWLVANFKQSAKLSINNSAVYIKIGDLHAQEGLKAIAFNEYFDTIVDDVIISRSSLNGQYLIDRSPRDIKILDNNIKNDVRLQERIVEARTNRQTGKKIKYKLGSIYLDNDYMLTAFSRFDDSNRAFLSLKEYVSCMLNFWDEVDQIYAGRSVAVPLMGSGITRFKDAEVQPQELLQILIWTFKISRVKFKHPANATIVIHESMADKINLYDLV